MREVSEVPSPGVLQSRLPLGQGAAKTVTHGRTAAKAILQKRDDRLLVIVGPCSIHDPTAALEYAMRLAEQREYFAEDLDIVMRAYLEKPRTTVGWKGLINDPNLDGTFQITKGLHLARLLLRDICELGLPVGCEFLDPMSSAYLTDLVAWGAIGARTTESQVHREMASGLPCPMGFKNGTDGEIMTAVDAIRAASSPHHFLGIAAGMSSAVVATEGNPDCHIILRGGREPNYSSVHVSQSCDLLATVGLPQRVMIDASHGNSRKRPQEQIPVCADIASQMADGDGRIVGVMVESFLFGGRQEVVSGVPLAYGQSITDGCIGWEDTLGVLEVLAEGVRNRRGRRPLIRHIG